jgi:alkylation response protein AidB-like acyl-CoA dehydrogenase
MDLELTEDQRELRTVARQLLDDVAPLRVARAFLDGVGDIAPVSKALAELGWYSVGTDGDPFGVPGLCLLAEQCGAHAAPTLLVDTAVAVRLARAVDDPAPLATRIAAGEVATALAVLESDSFASEAAVGEGGYVVEARKLGVQHGATAEAFAVVADCDGTPGVFFVDADVLGVGALPVTALDPASAPTTVAIAGVPIERGCALVGDDASEALDAAFAVGAVATAAEGAGAASAALDLAVAYAKEREQFGRPIGQFQALQHVIAEAHVDREATWSSILYAAAALEENLPDADEATAIAKAQAARGTRCVVESALQVLGGIAFTWEHDVHLLQRRVLACERRFGDAVEHERALGARLAARALEAVA